MAAAREVVIIGAGHNGLVAAFCLARAGYRPLVLERRAAVGGAAITKEFHPGFRCSTLADACGPLLPEVFADMRLERHGLQMLPSDARLFAPGPDGHALVLRGDAAGSAQAIAAFSPQDAERYLEFHETLSRIGAALRPLLSLTPPDIDRPTTRDILWMLRTGLRIRRLGKKDLYRLLRWAPMPVADLVAEWFESEPLRAAIAARGVFGSSLGPRSPGTGALFLLRAALDGDPVGGTLFPRGGMGALSEAIASAARETGAEIRTGSGVARIDVKGGAAVGVTLESGESIPCRGVVSNTDPRRTFLGLLDPEHLSPGFLRMIRNYRSSGTIAKVNLALGGLPVFTALGPSLGGKSGRLESAQILAGRIRIGPEIDYLERAFDDAKYGDLSRRPCLEITIPSIRDPALAPAGRHVMSICAQYAPYRLKTGDWRMKREEAGDVVVETLSAHAPGLPGMILGRQVITPLDLEERYGLTGGQIFHGEMALDQLFTMRPLLGWARYRTPIRGLYLCGAGTHPGGGVHGLPGRNAAREILTDLR